MNILVFMGKWVGRNCADFLLREFPEDRYTFIVTDPERKESLDFLSHHGQAPMELNEKSIETLNAFEPDHFDWLLNLWGGYIFKPSTLQLARRSLNIHPGYLPHCRGRDPVVWAIRKELPAGVALHAIERTVDTGAIWYREEVPYALPVHGKELYEKVIDRSWRAFCEQWPSIRTATTEPIIQEAAPPPHTRKELLEDRWLDLDANPEIKDVVSKLLSHDFSPSYTARLTLNGQAYDATLSLTPCEDETGNSNG